MKIKERVEKMRIALDEKGVSAYIIPSSDPHQSEYVADHWQARSWISGFTGSAGTVAITPYKAALWTDSRYFLQGVEQLEGTGIDLMKQGLSETPSLEEWILANVKAGDVVACDGANFSAAYIQKLNRLLENNHIILDYNFDVFKKIWNNRPPLPQTQVFEHDVQFAGKSRVEKIAAVRSNMGNADAHLITTLDDIAWLLNIRGSDVECNPVSIAYCIVEKTRVYLFIDENKLSKELESSFANENIFIKPYDEITSFLKSMSDGQSILINMNTVSAQLYDAIPRNVNIVKGNTIPTRLKTIKNNTEIKHIREVMAKDAVALQRLFMWLDKELEHRKVSEVEVSDQLASFRKMGSDYYGESFPAIVGYKGNGAIVHYRPEEGKCAMIAKEGILLLDSGGQYHNGTTDITRTVSLGNPTAIQKRHFTLVLKGHIALAMQHFPKGTLGIQLDTLTRQFLWKDDLNFGHGTGHGVGFFLNVHEGPQGIGPIPQGRYMEPFYEGMFTSNEPGLYITNEYGIRIENLVLAVNATKGDFGQFLQFETVTLFPIDQQLIDKELMTTEEINWLNNYHQEVWEKVSPLLSTEEEREWLKVRCGEM